MRPAPAAPAGEPGLTTAAVAVRTGGRAAVRGATPIALAGLLANLANIGVTLLVARLLTTRGYGALNQLIAVYFVLSITGSALLIGVVRRLTLWERTGHGARVAGWAQRIRRRGVVLVVVWAVVAVAIRVPLAHQLSLPGPGGLAETLVAGALWGLLCLERSLLQARHAYPQLGVNLLVEGVGRSILTVVLVAAGFGVTGAAVGILVSVLLGIGHARFLEWSPRRAGAPGRAAVQPVDLGGAVLVPAFGVDDRRRERRALAGDLLSSLAALALLAVLQNFDVVLLGRERPGNAGTYAPLSVACKPLVLAAFVLVGFLVPEVASHRHAGEHALKQLGVVLAVIAAPAGLLVLLAAAVPRRLLQVAFGARLTAGAPAFLSLALAMTLLAATVLFTHYLLAAGHRSVLLVLAAGTALTVVLLVLAHGALVATARADLVGQAVLAVATALLVLRSARPARVARQLG